MGWDDNGLNVERRVQLVTGTIVDPTLPYDPDFQRPEKVDPKARPIPVSRPNFIELCEEVVPQFEAEYHDLWSTVGLSVDWEHTYTTIGPKATRTSQRGFLRLVAPRPRLPQPSRRPSGTSTCARRSPRPSSTTGSSPARTTSSCSPAPTATAADRHHPARAAAGLRGGRRPPRRRALPAAVRPDAPPRRCSASRSRSSPTSSPTPRRAPASR